jgi:hypothetical protein
MQYGIGTAFVLNPDKSPESGTLSTFQDGANEDKQRSGNKTRKGRGGSFHEEPTGWDVG